jgi:hypothetical protein
MGANWDAFKKGMMESPIQKAMREQEEKAAKQAALVCPHCQQGGGVTSKQVKKKGGISGGKATAAILTGGVSLVGTGLAKKGFVNELSCSNCGMVWHVA